MRGEDSDQLAAISWLSRFNAWFFDNIDRYANYIAHVHKKNAFEGIRSGTIVELGAGTGANFRYFPSGSRVVAIEPSVAMHDRLRRNAEQNNIDLELIAVSADRIPIDDDSVDEVIATLVLCTVADPRQVLLEVRRILRPGGTFRFVEHVAAHPLSPRRWLQRLLAPLWAWVFEGCDLQRDTASQIANAGFAAVTIKPQRFRHSLFFPVNSAIYGMAKNGAT